MEHFLQETDQGRNADKFWIEVDVRPGNAAYKLYEKCGFLYVRSHVLSTEAQNVEMHMLRKEFVQSEPPKTQHCTSNAVWLAIFGTTIDGTSNSKDFNLESESLP
uniref:N-acetyltransferase domain-containing protein n=1 Tax=Ditylenchus dipsaci TaxID=166011 RepID=A0A915D9U1_9BILA